MCYILIQFKHHYHIHHINSTTFSCRLFFRLYSFNSDSFEWQENICYVHAHLSTHIFATWNGFFIIPNVFYWMTANRVIQIIYTMTENTRFIYRFCIQTANRSKNNTATILKSKTLCTFKLNTASLSLLSLYCYLQYKCSFYWAGTLKVITLIQRACLTLPEKTLL